MNSKTQGYLVMTLCAAAGVLVADATKRLGASGISWISNKFKEAQAETGNTKKKAA